jgi:hypothetical protein
VLESCGLRDGAWGCIKHGDSAFTPVRTTSSALTAVASDYHHCALDAGDDVWCVGRNDAGQVDPDDARPEVPEPHRHPGPFSTVVALQDGTCASSENIVTCWGGRLP